MTGKWTYEQPAMGQRPARQVTITLKQDGSTLTGSIPGFARGGGEAPPPTEISNGKVEGDKVSFEVKMTRGDQTFVTKYEGMLAGDDLKLEKS